MFSIDYLLPSENKRVIFEQVQLNKTPSKYYFDFDSFWCRNFDYNNPQPIYLKESNTNTKTDSFLLNDKFDFEEFRSVLNLKEKKHNNSGLEKELDFVSKIENENMKESQNLVNEESEEKSISYEDENKEEIVEQKFNEDIKKIQKGFAFKNGQKNEENSKKEGDFYFECFQPHFEHDLSKPEKVKKDKKIGDFDGKKDFSENKDFDRKKDYKGNKDFDRKKDFGGKKRENSRKGNDSDRKKTKIKSFKKVKR